MMFEAYVTNVGMYPEYGVEVGEYLKFPTTVEEVQALFSRIGIDGKRYEEYFITSYESDVLGLYDHLGEYESLDELNYLAHLLEEMSPDELEKLEAVMDAGEHTGSVKDLATYFATATEDEYDEIAQTIRQDLVFSEYGQDIENLIQYIPNTSEDCPTCRESYPAQAFLVSVNTGEIYSLDLYQIDENPGEESSGMRLNFGYDEISEARIHIITYQGTQNGYAEIYRGRRIISAQKMKSIFCDDCIREILNTIDGQLLEEIVLFDAEQKAFFPIKDGEALQIGSYELAVSYDSGDFRIDIEYVSE